MPEAGLSVEPNPLLTGQGQGDRISPIFPLDFSEISGRSWGRVVSVKRSHSGIRLLLIPDVVFYLVVRGRVCHETHRC